MAGLGPDLRRDDELVCALTDNAKREMGIRTRS